MIKISKSKLVIMLVSIILCTATIKNPVEAYTHTGRWIDSVQTVIPYYGLSEMSITHIGNSLSQWNVAAEKFVLTMVKDTSHSLVNYPTRDSDNCIYKMSTGTNDYVAQTYSWYTSAGKITEFDINFNMYYPYTNGQLSGYYDTYSVFLHEAGHAIGMGHSSYKSSVMYPYVYKDTLRRTLSDDDILGAKTIYN